MGEVAGGGVLANRLKVVTGEALTDEVETEETSITSSCLPVKGC